MISLGLDVDEDEIIPDAPAPSDDAPPALGDPSASAMERDVSILFVFVTLGSPADILLQVTKPRRSFLPRRILFLHVSICLRFGLRGIGCKIC